MSNSLQPVAEIEAELENRWYTLEEQAREQMNSSNNQPNTAFNHQLGGMGNTSPTLEDLKQ